MAPRPLLLGHRGLRGRRYKVRENTVAAFDLALEYGCDGLEFDVRFTADEQAIICHNARISGLTIAKASRKQFPALPSLTDVLARYARRAFLDIELKVTGLESCVLSALAAHTPQRGYVISSFLPQVLIDVNARNQSVPLGLVCETKRELQRWPDLPVDYVIAKHSLANPKLIADVHSAGKKIFVWTVNDARSMLRVARWGVDGIISDRPDVLVRTFRTPYG